MTMLSTNHNFDIGLINRVSHPGSGIPEDLVQQMYDRSQEVTQEGMGLSVSRKLLKLMNGDVKYVREPEAGVCCFVVHVELPLVQTNDQAAKGLEFL